MQLTNLLATTALLAAVNAHPGHDIAEEMAERRSFVNTVRHTNLAHCADKLKARGVEDRNVARRSERINAVRAERGLTQRPAKRDLEDVLNTDHDKTELGYTPDTPADVLFTGNASCLLTPEVTQGPYYVGGEYVRENVIEDQAGVNLLLDYQVIDVDTCEPVPDVYVEIWHCNSTGVYSGVVAGGNGDQSDETNIDNTWLRGIQPTDADGVAGFETTFPGHYTGRATHIHLMVHTNATLQANETLGNDIYASHIGQAFFDQTLITDVELLAPYADNTQTLTTNAEDSILEEEAATGTDPSMLYTLLDNDVSGGIFAWMAFGINVTASSSISPAVFYYEGGGVANPDAGGGGPPGGEPPVLV